MGLVVAALLHVTVIAGVARVRRRQLVAWQRAMQGDRFERDRALRLLQAIADVSTDAIFAKDLEGRYMLVNRAAAAFTGLVPDEMVGRDDSGIVSAAEFARVREHERLVAREGRVMSFEEAVTLPMGERVFQSSKGLLRDGDGRLFGVYGISRDVTEQLREERAIEAQARALASSVAELERFNRVLVDREITMIELKRRLNAALRELGRPQPFDLGSVDLDGRGDD